jgi:microcystin degradation protein MlrC
MFRTYPHLDMAEAGARAVPILQRQIAGERPAKAFRQVPYLIPLHAQFTGIDPAMGLYAEIAARTREPNVWTEFAVGFTGGDTVHTGPALLAYGTDQAQVNATADGLLEAVRTAERAFVHPLVDARAAVRAAMAMAPGKPVIIADVQDNPGGGGSSDTTGLLRALVEETAQGALLGVLHDPDAALAAHQAGLGARMSLALGGRSGIAGDAPFESRFEVCALSAGEVRYEGEMYGGGVAQIGPCALLRPCETAADVRIVVSSVRNQCLDRAYFRHIGLTPEDARILVVKSTVHFRADFAPIAQAVLTARAPGALGCALAEIPYRNIRAGMRLGPGGPEYRPGAR